MRKCLVYCVILVSSSAPALAQDEREADTDTADLSTVDFWPGPRETAITVTATGDRLEADATGLSVTIFGDAAIDAVQGTDPVRVLEKAPGVAISRNGGQGAFTGLHVRGADAEQTLVLIDGVRVADPSSPGGGFDLGSLLSGNVAKIELLRSSNSVIWGSQAMGGVLAITSDRVWDRAVADVEYGAHDTVNATFAGGVGSDSRGLSAFAGYTRSDGISAAAGGTEPDGLRQWEAGLRGQARIAGGLRLAGNLRYSEGRLDYDGFPAPDYVLADTDDYQDTRQLFAAASIGWQDDRGKVTADASYSRARTERDLFDNAASAAPSYSAGGTGQHAELRTLFRDIADNLSLRAGVERDWNRFSSTDDGERSASSWGSYAQLRFANDGFTLAGGARREEHAQFGGRWTLGGDAAYEFGRYGAQWRLAASLGQGFKVPTLYQMFSDYGNAGLTPETSLDFELSLAFDRLRWGGRAGAFRRDSSDLIAFVSCYGDSGGICADRPYGTYDNIGKARSQGIEAELWVEPVERLKVQANYTYLEAVDRGEASANRGRALARRPRHVANLWFDYTPLDLRWRLGADLRIVSGSFDDAANLVPLRGHVTAAIRGGYAVWQNAAQTAEVELYGRIENLWDERYQTAAGYGSPGRAVYVGLRGRF